MSQARLNHRVVIEFKGKYPLSGPALEQAVLRGLATPQFGFEGLATVTAYPSAEEILGATGPVAEPSK